jgi:uncharacterized protein
MSTPPGWYDDPGGSGAQRWWDGTAWTQQTQSRPQAAVGGLIPQDSRNMAMLAHLSGLFGLMSGVFGFLGPLIIYLVKTDDPWVRREAAEALNFNLSVLLYGAIGLVVTLVLLALIVGILLIPLWIAAGVAWVVLMILAGMKAQQGQPYRYPLTIRFVSP